MTTFLIATGNHKKLGEIRTILGGQFAYLSLRDFPDAPAVVEDADTFAGNAAKKAFHLADWLAPEIQRSKFKVEEGRTFVLADDSGLEVDALGGAPGVFSARFAAIDQGCNSTDEENNVKLLRLLQHVPSPQRTARFRCALALMEINPQSPPRQPELFEGVCEGRIVRVPKGRRGFGYDPLFVPVGCKKSFAELEEDVKNQLSHRARALAKLRAWLIEIGLVTAPPMSAQLE